MSSDRIQPHDLAAETAVLGAMMLSKPAATEALSLLSATDFYRMAHQRIFEAAASLYDKGEAVDQLTIAAEVGASLDSVGGKAYILDVASSVPVSYNIGEYARIVKRCSLLRGIIVAADAATSGAYGESDPDAVIGKAVDSLLAMQRGEGEAESLADVVRRRIAEYRKPTATLICPGTATLLHFGDLTVLGGRPGTGKTAYAIQCADVWRQRYKTAFLSYEMDAGELADRFISRATKLPSSFAYDGVSEHEAEGISGKCSALLADKNLAVRRAAGMGESALAAFVRSFAASGGKVVIIDYLQIAFDSRDGDYADLTRLTRLLQMLGKSTGVAIIALSQYSREGTDKPRLSHLRGSGAIEQEAANVGLMWAPDDEEQEGYKRDLSVKGWLLDPFDSKQKLVRIHWAKVRHGESKTDYFTFDGAAMHFESLDREVR